MAITSLSSYAIRLRDDIMNERPLTSKDYESSKDLLRNVSFQEQSLSQNTQMLLLV
jgi:hypothetical protein